MSRRESTTALVLATVAFSISFAVWGMIAPMAKTFQATYHLTEQQTWLLIAVPVLLGSVMRLPMGMLADKYGGRLVFGTLLLFLVVPATMLSRATGYRELLFWGLVLGMAGTSFSVGVAFASRWFPPERQGLALGVFGAGNIGQSVALYGVPVLAKSMGWPATYRLFGFIALAWGVGFVFFARNAAARVAPKPMGAMLKVLAEEPLSWLLALYYFVTFGGFVALSIGLPTVLQNVFKLARADAGLRVAGFVLITTAMRPVGGWVSDRIGGARVLQIVFGGAALMALGMAFEQMVPFTIGALGVGAFIGLGNGAVFKLVPQYFPADTGTVTGLVGAMGGLGGFFPPLVLGFIKTQTGHYSLGFVLLAAFCIVCLLLNRGILLRRKVGGASQPASDLPSPA